MRSDASAGNSDLSELKMNIWPRTGHWGYDDPDSGDEGMDGGVAARMAQHRGLSVSHVQSAQSSKLTERAPDLSTSYLRSDI